MSAEVSTFSKAHRDKPLMHTVAFHDVPMFRGLALAIDHIEHHGAPVSIFSADRRDDVLKRFNREHGTKLHGQRWLISAHAHDPQHYAPANPVTQTSHCLYADQAVAGLLARHGKHVKVGGRLPWYALGIDLSDRGKVEDCSRFLEVAHHLGYAFHQPYSSGSERHHVICVKSPVQVLARWNVIPKRGRG